MKNIWEQYIIVRYLTEGNRKDDVGLRRDLERALEGLKNPSKTTNLDRFFSSVIKKIPYSEIQDIRLSQKSRLSKLKIWRF